MILVMAQPYLERDLPPAQSWILTNILVNSQPTPTSQVQPPSMRVRNKNYDICLILKPLIYLSISADTLVCFLAKKWVSFIHADSGFYFDWLAFPPLMCFLCVFYYLFVNLFGTVLVVPLFAFMCIVLSVYLFKSVKVLKYFCLEWLIIFWWKLLFDAHRDQIKILKPRLQSFKCQLKMWNYFSLYVHDVFFWTSNTFLAGKKMPHIHPLLQYHSLLLTFYGSKRLKSCSISLSH